MQRIDNEVSKILIESIESKCLKHQLASPHDHRLNPAERAVQTWKNHFISNLHGCDSEFPAYKWCEIMHQCEMTLNMLRYLESIQRCQHTLNSLDRLTITGRHWHY